MKRLAFTGLTVILVLFLAACGGEMSGVAPNSGEIEYTDVVYSKDGSSIELYLDGVGVPVTAAQRALTLDLATMSHDYFEVIFINGTTRARASWEIGQSAGIRGVDRAATAGVKYDAVDGTAGVAAIFVGRKSDRTLLGVGFLTHVDRIQGQTLTSSSKSVTFTVIPVNTRLTATGGGPQAQGTEQPGPLSYRPSFYLGAALATGTATAAPSDSTTGTRSKWTTLDGVEYPMFNIDKWTSTLVDTAARYMFRGALSGTAPSDTEAGLVASASVVPPQQAVVPPRLNNAVKYFTTATLAKPEIIKRDPRFLSGGALWYIQDSRMDQATTVRFAVNKFGGAVPQFTEVAGATTGGFDPNVDIVFTTKEQSIGGIFSFTFQIPVFLVTQTAATNGGPAAEQWYVRPGYGVPLYNLDNGVDAGGCVLMGVDLSDINWLEIFTRGIGFSEPPML